MLVFVYGSLKKGFYNHTVLQGAPKVADDVLHGFDLYSLGAFPCIVRGNGVVHGEVYQIDERVLASLDYLEGHPSFYHRQVVSTDKHKNVYTYVMDHVPQRGVLIPEGAWT